MQSLPNINRKSLNEKKRNEKKCYRSSSCEHHSRLWRLLINNYRFDFMFSMLARVWRVIHDTWLTIILFLHLICKSCWNSFYELQSRYKILLYSLPTLPTVREYINNSNQQRNSIIWCVIKFPINVATNNLLHSRSKYFIYQLKNHSAKTSVF